MRKMRTCKRKGSAPAIRGASRCLSRSGAGIPITAFDTCKLAANVQTRASIICRTDADFWCRNTPTCSDPAGLRSRTAFRFPVPLFGIPLTGGILRSGKSHPGRNPRERDIPALFGGNDNDLASFRFTGLGGE